jgi:signal transduction histidine kinase/DNA-binding response OmpR family regulator
MDSIRPKPLSPLSRKSADEYLSSPEIPPSFIQGIACFAEHSPEPQALFELHEDALGLSVIERVTDSGPDGIVEALANTSVESPEDPRRELEENFNGKGAQESHYPQWKLVYANSAAHKLFAPSTLPLSGKFLGPELSLSPSEIQRWNTQLKTLIKSGDTATLAFTPLIPSEAEPISITLTRLESLGSKTLIAWRAPFNQAQQAEQVSCLDPWLRFRQDGQCLAMGAKYASQKSASPLWGPFEGCREGSPLEVGSLTPSQATEFRLILAECLQSGEERLWEWGGEAGGHWTFLEVRLCPESEFTALCVVRNSASWREREEGLRQQLESMKTQGEVVNRIDLTAQAQFIANISHELRTPMNGIIGMMDLMVESDLKPDQFEMAQAVHHSAESLLEVVNGLLDFSKIEAGRMELESLPFSPQGLAEEVSSLFRKMARDKGLKFLQTYDSDLPTRLLGDPLRLRQILLNLIGNAVKFTERGKVQITVEASPAHRDEKGQEQVQLRIEVSDTGIGISESARHRIFRPFSQGDGSTTRRFGGTGLGLAISEGLAALMGGEIQVESHPEQGSHFIFSALFRVTENQLEPVAPLRPLELEPSQSPSTRRFRLLLAEDNVINRQVVRHTFRNSPFEWVCVETGIDALEAMRKGGFDLVLMDCQMPLMDGIEATREYRLEERKKPTQHLPIIALTANVLPSMQTECKEAGMDGFIGKPFRADELRKRVVEILEKNSTSGKKSLPFASPVFSSPEISPSQYSPPFAAKWDETGASSDSSSEGNFRKELLNTFTLHAKETLASIDHSLRMGDRKSLKKAAHSLKGGSGYFKDLSLGPICDAMEALAEEDALITYEEVAFHLKKQLNHWLNGKPT